LIRPVNAVLTTPTTLVAGDAKHRQFADNVAERDRAFTAHLG
jgi:hypothetical protein